MDEIEKLQKNLINGLNSVYRLIQDIEWSGASDLFSNKEYDIIYKSLKDASDYIKEN